MSNYPAWYLKDTERLKFINLQIKRAYKAGNTNMVNLLTAQFNAIQRRMVQNVKS